MLDLGEHCRETGQSWPKIEGGDEQRELAVLAFRGNEVTGAKALLAARRAAEKRVSL